MPPTAPPTLADPSSLRPAAWILLGATFLALLAIAHHPVLHASPTATPAQVLAGLAAQQGMDRLVHGSLIALLVAFLVGRTRFALWQGLHRLAAVAALIAYAGGIAATCGAAIIDGFVLPAITTHYLTHPDPAGTTAIAAPVLSSLIVQAASRVGLALLASGVLLWGALLCPTVGRHRATGYLGLAAGAATLAVILFYPAPLTPHLLLPLLAALGAWNIAVAWLMLTKN